MCADLGLSAEQAITEAFAAPVLVGGIDVTEFEPDAPNYTPRITGCIRSGSAALSISRRRADGTAERSTYDVSDTTAGEGWLLTTYTGVNANPLPAFEGGPVRLDIRVTSAEGLATAIYAALAPVAGKDDLRVAVTAVAYGADRPYATTNRVDQPSG
jgi:hypothetical protein